MLLSPVQVFWSLWLLNFPFAVFSWVGKKLNTDGRSILLNGNYCSSFQTIAHILMFYLFLRERARVGEGQREGLGDRGSEVSPALTTACPMWGLNSQTPRSRPEPKSDAQPTEPPRRPNSSHLKTNGKSNKKRSGSHLACGYVDLCQGFLWRKNRDGDIKPPWQ